MVEDIVMHHIDQVNHYVLHTDYGADIICHLTFFSISSCAK